MTQKDLSPPGPGILIVAPNASSRFGGEAFLPLHYFRLLRQRGYRVYLITHARNRDDLTAYLPNDLDRIIFVEDTFWHKTIWRLGACLPAAINDTVFSNLLNLVNEGYQRREIRRLLAREPIGLIHQPTPVSPLAPSFIYGFGIPVVIGPMNGNMSYPEGYDHLQSRKTRLFIRGARFMAKLVNVFVPGKRKAAALLVANERTRRGVYPPTHPNVIDLVENGVDLSLWQANASHAPRQSSQSNFRLIFMGRLVGWKAVDITLQALARARENGIDASLDILGDGPQEIALRHQCDRLGLNDHVHFHGFVQQKDCLGYLQRADALILNSVWECGGAVVLEAMCAGLPVIASDWGGPADYLDESCGILVAPEPVEDFDQRLATAIIQIATDPKARQNMGAAGQAKIRAHYDWEKKVDRMIEIYGSVL